MGLTRFRLRTRHQLLLASRSYARGLCGRPDLCPLLALVFLGFVARPKGLTNEPPTVLPPAVCRPNGPFIRGDTAAKTPARIAMATITGHRFARIKPAATAKHNSAAMSDRLGGQVNRLGSFIRTSPYTQVRVSDARFPRL